MTEHFDIQTLAAHADLVAAPADARACEDRTFGLPRALHYATAGLFLAYMVIMATGFRHQELVVPMAINFIFIAAMFGVPALWATMKPANASRALHVDEFIANGFDCHTGHVSAGSATAQVLVMPILVLLWGIAMVTIAALV